MAGGGVGEAMLISAAVGGGTSALRGDDPLKGALMGAAMGGAGYGINQLLPGAVAAEKAVEVGTNVGGNSALGLKPSDVAFTEGLRPTQVNSPEFSLATPGASITPPGEVTLRTTTPNEVGETALAQTPAPQKGILSGLASLTDKQKLLTAGGAGLTAMLMAERRKTGAPPSASYSGPLSRYSFNPSTFNPRFYAAGGIASLNPMAGSYDRIVGDQPAGPRMARGGVADLGSYSDGGRMLRGPGDGMSDSIPGVLSNRRPARLADGEFVVPADVVSHLGNGSTDAGAKQLYSMMDRVRKARTGTKQQGRKINPVKYTPS